MEIQKIAEQLLTEKKVDCIIGYEKGFDDAHPMPCIISSPDAVQKLIFNNNCFHNLSKYVLRVRGKKIGVFVKGCDLFSLRELIKEHQVKREDLVIIALACDGIKDRQAIKRTEDKLAAKCIHCGVKIPKEDVDYVIGVEKIKQTIQGEGIDKELLAKLSDDLGKDFVDSILNSYQKDEAGIYEQRERVSELKEKLENRSKVEG